jgi:hypothetical protein
MGSNGCLAYGAPTACGAHQTCTVAAGTASCTCNADPTCTTGGTTCQGQASYVTCQTDGQGCVYAAGTTSCPNGACYDAAGSAQCCTNGCSPAGSRCQGNTPITCAVGSNGCLQQTQGTACSGSTPTCMGGSCIAQACNISKPCGTGYCCSGSTCVSLGPTTCAESGGPCVDCTDGTHYGSACLAGGKCGCASNADCTSNLDGNYCFTGGGLGNGPECGCRTVSDCPANAGGCCSSGSFCTPFGWFVPAGYQPANTVCSVGSFINPATNGAPCSAQTCGASLCCDQSQFPYGRRGVCTESSGCGSDGMCGGSQQPCCAGTRCAADLGLSCKMGLCQ